MLKIFRKFQKPLLVVAGIFLMIVFVAPRAITSYGKGLGNRTESYIGNQKVSSRDIQLATREREAVRSLLSPFSNPQALDAGTGKNGLHWLLLSHAASEGGFVGEAGDGQAWLVELSKSYAEYMERVAQQTGQLDLLPDSSDEVLALALTELQGLHARAAGANRLQPDEFDLALAKARGIDRMLTAYTKSARTSAPAAISRAKQRLDSVDLDYLFIQGGRAYDGEISDNQLQAHFERFQDIEPGEGEYGIGYVRPQRVTFETITLERDAIEESIPITAREMVDEYQSNPDGYVTDFDESLSGEELKAARQAEYEKARRLLKRKRADELVIEAGAQLRRLILPNLEFDEKGRVVIPEGSDHAGPTLEELADGLVTHLGSFYKRRYGAGAGAFTAPRPRINVYASTWRTLSELGRIPDLGLSNVTLSGNRRLRFANFVLSVKELSPDADFGPQRGVLAVESPIENGVSGNIAYVRVLGVKDRSPADTLDEVREQAEGDLRALLGYGQIESRVDEFQSLAIAEGLGAVASLFDDPPIEVPEEEIVGDGTDNAEGPAPDDEPETEPETEPADPPKPRRLPIRVQNGASLVGDSIQRRFGGISEISDETLVERLKLLAAQLDPLTILSETPADSRTIAMALPKLRGIAIVQITSILPLTVERFRTAEGERASLAKFIGIQDAYSLKAMVERMDVRGKDGGSVLDDDEVGGTG